MTLAPDRPVKDTVPGGWVEHAPDWSRPYLRLARYDRPVGFWLLALPCWAGLALANLDGVWRPAEVAYLALFLIGAVAMRGAGCTYNDIIDKDLDAQVARTADRPLPAGTVTPRAAWGFLAAQCLVGLLVLLALPRAAQLTALAAIPLVAAYPFMKRITWFPQAWLGLTFNWGALVGFAAGAEALSLQAWLLYAGLAVWTFGYDTIYAHQDKEDDALIGVKSTARLFGRRSRLAVALSYALAAVLVGTAALYGALGAAFNEAPVPAGAFAGGLFATAFFAALLAVQVMSVRFDDARSCLAWFKSNQWTGLALAVSLGFTPLLIQSLLA